MPATAETPAKKKTYPTPTLDVRCTDQDKELFKQVAEIEGVLRPNGEPNVSQWILAVLRREARKIINREQGK